MTNGETLTVLPFDRESSELRLSRAPSGAGDKTGSACSVDTVGGVLNLRIFLDTSYVEVFVNGGGHSDDQPDLSFDIQQ